MERAKYRSGCCAHRNVIDKCDAEAHPGFFRDKNLLSASRIMLEQDIEDAVSAFSYMSFCPSQPHSMQSEALDHSHGTITLSVVVNKQGKDKRLVTILAPNAGTMGLNDSVNKAAHALGAAMAKHLDHYPAEVLKQAAKAYKVGEHIISEEDSPYHTTQGKVRKWFVNAVFDSKCQASVIASLPHIPRRDVTIVTTPTRPEDTPLYEVHVTHLQNCI